MNSVINKANIASLHGADDSYYEGVKIYGLLNLGIKFLYQKIIIEEFQI